MIRSLLSAALGLALAAAPPATPEQIVQRQVDAYNAHDLEAFMATYATDAKVHFGLGADAKVLDPAGMRVRYGNTFKGPDLHCQILGRLVMGGRIIDREHVTGVPDVGVREAVAIYQIKEGLIQEAWILVD